MSSLLLAVSDCQPASSLLYCSKNICGYTLFEAFSVLRHWNPCISKWDECFKFFEKQKMLSTQPPQGHPRRTFYQISCVDFAALSQLRIFSCTLRHKWTRLIDFLSSRIALIAGNMADESSWLCVHWDKVGRQTGSCGWVCHSRGPGFITPTKSPLALHSSNPDPHPTLPILYLPPN